MKLFLSNIIFQSKIFFKCAEKMPMPQNRAALFE